MRIIKRGYYTNTQGNRVFLETNSSQSFYAVDLYSPEFLQKIIQNASTMDFKMSFKVHQPCSFYMVDADSYEAAQNMKSPLVMNFANAHYPGGGFLQGASAQEESLCRTSTLYASISSGKARAMYDYNRLNGSACDSDFMLISPNVLVFRDRDCNLRTAPYQVAVATVAAPNKNGPARNVSQTKLDHVMKNRLRKFLYVAAKNRYRNLILGAWGCGAFGNNPNNVAQYFYELFFEENLADYFETVVFAILGGGDNYNAFKRVFCHKIKNCS